MSYILKPIKMKLILNLKKLSLVFLLLFSSYLLKSQNVIYKVIDSNNKEFYISLHDTFCDLIVDSFVIRTSIAEELLDTLYSRTTTICIPQYPISQNIIIINSTFITIINDHNAVSYDIVGILTYDEYNSLYKNKLIIRDI